MHSKEEVRHGVDRADGGVTRCAVEECEVAVAVLLVGKADGDAIGGAKCGPRCVRINGLVIAEELYVAFSEWDCELAPLTVAGGV